MFDIGDVLFVSHTQPDFFQHWERRLGLMPGTLSQFLWHGRDIEAANAGRITAEEYAHRCATRLGVDEGMALALLEDAFSGERLNDELVSYIQTLKPQLQIVALTNNWSFGRRLIDRRGLSRLFDLIVVSAEEGVRKPDPRLYQILLARLGITAAEVVFVDDNAENIEAAGGLGLRGVHFRSTEQAISELNELLQGRTWHTSIPD